MIHKGLIKDQFRLDRPEAECRPVLAYFGTCENVNITGVTMQNSSSWVQIYDQCKTVKIDSITVDSKTYWNNDGIDIVDCDGVTVTDSFIDSDDDGICLKSHDASKVCKDIVIRNCTIRDYRTDVVPDDVRGATFNMVKITKPDKREWIFSHKSTGIQKKIACFNRPGMGYELRGMRALYLSGNQSGHYGWLSYKRCRFGMCDVPIFHRPIIDQVLSVPRIFI